jgi:hypothetical protein
MKEHILKNAAEIVRLHTRIHETVRHRQEIAAGRCNSTRAQHQDTTALQRAASKSIVTSDPHL